jgi:hypothetical protein
LIGRRTPEGIMKSGISCGLRNRSPASAFFDKDPVVLDPGKKGEVGTRAA